jgi:hypothetical protein
VSVPVAAGTRRHLDVVDTFPNEASITRVRGPLLLERSDVWQLQRRDTSFEALRILNDNQPARLSSVVS